VVAVAAVAVLVVVSVAATVVAVAADVVVSAAATVVAVVVAVVVSVAATVVAVVVSALTTLSLFQYNVSSSHRLCTRGRSRGQKACERERKCNMFLTIFSQWLQII